MKNKLIKKRLLLSILSLSLISMTGCKNENNNEANNISTTEITSNLTTEVASEEANEEFKTEEITTEIKEETETEDINTEYVTTEATISKDETIKSNIEQYKNEIEYYLSEKNIDLNTIKEKGKAFFIKYIDFIFYDTEINGVRFDELTDETKEDIYDTFCYIDELIMNVAPNYKENISEKYEVVKDFTNKAYYNSLDKIKEALGEDNYNKVKEIKDNIKNNISDGAENVKKKVKNWYEEFKEN